MTINESLPEWMLDEDTPPQVRVTGVPRTPVEDPRLGINFSVPAVDTPRHRLVSIGDSLTHGFQSGAIYNTDISYPAIIAHELGWSDYFRYPSYYGQGGLPLNLEFLIRELEWEFGDKVNLLNAPRAANFVRQFMARVEDWWERGLGTHVTKLNGINHNLAVYGWDLRDTLELTADRLLDNTKNSRDYPFWQIVENANERAALRVLRSARTEDGQALTPLGAAAALGNEGTFENPGEGHGIETLIVMLGANNALASMIQLKVKWSEEGYDNLETKKEFTVWNPDHFENELDLVVQKVKEIKARHVIWCTVPHVTIAPIARGVGGKMLNKSRYFDFYTRPWIRDRDFDPNDDRCITGQQALAIDSAIDQYNEAITSVVREAREGEERDWYLFDTAGLLDRLASRRYIEDPGARPEWWSPYKLPPELEELSPVPNSRFFESGPKGRTDGGLFSLDGVHPTTIGYGILAQELINVMQRHAGVKFYRGDGRTERTGPVRVNFRRLIERDTLISSPPQSLTSNMNLIGWIDRTLDGIMGRFLL